MCQTSWRRFLAREPDWTRLPAGLSPLLATFIKRCLRKDPHQRVRDIGDVSLALSGAFEAASSHRAATTPAPPFWRRTLPVSLAAIVAALVTGGAAWSRWPLELSPAPTRFDHVFPDGQPLATGTQRPVIAIAADGRRFLYQTGRGLFVRAMDELDAREIAGTAELSSSPFLSPDGQWAGYVGGGRNGPEIKKVPVAGGTPVTVSAATVPYGVSWADDNTILFGQDAGIMRVPANGGTAELIVKAGDGEVLSGPQLLPGGHALLFTVNTDRAARRNLAQVVVQALGSTARTVVVRGGSDARYLSSGHLVYAVGSVLFAAPFDPRRPAPVEGALPVIQGLQQPVGVNARESNFSVSDEGTLIYLTGGTSLRSLVWVNRDGTAGDLISAIAPAAFEDPRLSPDESRTVLTRDGDIWIYDLASGRSSRVTRDGTSLMGVWDPSGSRVAYSSALGGNLEAWVAPSDGGGQPQQLTSLGGAVHVDSWSPDGRILSIHHHPPQGPTNIFMLPMDRAEAKPEKWFDAAFTMEGAQFSRDMRRVTYLSQETGSREIYIRDYPGHGGQVTVSVGGGQEPVWAKNGEVFYRSLPLAGNRMFGVSVMAGPTLKVATPALLFQGPYYFSPTGSPRAQYDVTADGKRFLMLTSATGSDVRPRIVVVQHWFEELKKVLPTP